jgi:hypothetical protein
MEHRWGRRRTADVAVKIVTLPSISGIGRLINISATGALLETRTPLRLLSVIYIQPEEPDVSMSFADRLPFAEPRSGRTAIRHIAGSVVRHTEGGVGLEWCEFGTEATEVYLRLTRSSEDLSNTQQLALLEQGAPDPTYAAGAHALERLGLCKVRFVTGDSRSGSA